MKIKLAEVRQRHQALCTLASKKLPVKLSYAIGKNIMKLQEEMDVIEKERIKLVEQYAVKEEDGSFKNVDGHYDIGDNEQQLNAEYSELLNMDTEMEIHTVPEYIVECMDDPRYDVLTAAELIAIEFMLEHQTSEEVEPKA